MVSSLPAEYLDPDTPPEVVVTDQIRPLITDSTLGVPQGAAGPGLPSVPDPPRRQLVTVGDSLTHGMSSAAVFRTDLSWPALVARSLGAGFVVPAYGGPLDGLPLNLEKLLRDLQDKFGDTLDLLEMIRLPLELHSLADANEDYRERGDDSRPPRTDLRYENVGIYGWDVRDCLSSTTARALARIASHPPHDDLLGAKPDNDNDIAAASVLAPFGSAAAQIGAVASHGHDGGIGTLVVMLGRQQRARVGREEERGLVGAAIPGPGRQRRVYRLEPRALCGRVRGTRPPAAAGPRAPGAAGHRAARHRRADRCGGQPRQPGTQMAGRITLLPLLHRPVDRRERFPPRQAPLHHPPAGTGHRLCHRPVQRHHPGPCPQGPRRGPRRRYVRWC
jgi:hypothetical protein